MIKIKYALTLFLLINTSTPMFCNDAADRDIIAIVLEDSTQMIRAMGIVATRQEIIRHQAEVLASFFGTLYYETENSNTQLSLDLRQTLQRTELDAIRHGHTKAETTKQAHDVQSFFQNNHTFEPDYYLTLSLLRSRILIKNKDKDLVS